ncbi:glycosyltransferase [Nonlabens ponticola]|uniref:Glycosyltransferase n=1 Tax=Nonlabens ponticola TaxID=2496866 RepID=A0A3S9MXP8_9FLAO|nr:glycosyltransferase [Nonlabens ponticola]AZQ44021.1 glycosyltransferase [Nonlabens ponticola]
MQPLEYSFIIPVYNRPDEVEALLSSLSRLEFERAFEVVIIEDGSMDRCDGVCSRFRESLNISYFYKKNTGPGDSRNYGMQHANGNYFIILDSDCIIPDQYLNHVDAYLSINYVDCYGGPDAAHENFTVLQKAINYSMTSILTTGGIRGGDVQVNKFQPRSFNMGLSKEAFEATGGYGNIHPGEDPDLSIRLWNAGYKTALINEAHVYHERRTSWRLFYKQVRKFGMVRVILNKWHPSTAKLTYWFPTLFCVFVAMAILWAICGWFWYLYLVLVYVAIVFIHSTFKNGFKVGTYSVMATLIQFTGYGLGFLTSFIQINVRGRDEREAFPHLFF